jgi:hypothetical protein
VRIFRNAQLRLQAAAVLLLVSFCTGPLVLPHADPFGDPTCSPAHVEHDESAHRIGSAGTSSDDHSPHCLLCHWARAFCSLLPTGDHVAAHLTNAERLHATSIRPSDFGRWSIHHGRAPPA